jgi:hypothetical protein
MASIAQDQAERIEYVAIVVRDDDTQRPASLAPGHTAILRRDGDRHARILKQPIGLFGGAALIRPAG